MMVDPHLRCELSDLIHRFAASIDRRDWTGFRECLDDRVSVKLDDSIGGSNPAPQPAEDWVINARGFFDVLDATHHHVTPYEWTRDEDDDGGGAVTVMSYFRAGHFKNVIVGGATFDQVGTYHHRCVRREDGWRIAGWVQRVNYSEGNAKLLAVRGDGSPS